MKNKLRLLVLTLFLGFALSNQSYFKIDGMVCESGCSYKIKSVVNSISGVKESSVDFEKRILSVDYDASKVNEQIIIDRISEETTFKAKKVKFKKKKEGNSWFERWFY